MSGPSFVDYPEDHPFPIQNLPYGVFQPAAAAPPRIGVAIGDFVLDLAECSAAGLFTGPMLSKANCFQQECLNAFMGMGRDAWTEARTTITALLSADNATIRDNAALKAKVLVPMQDAIMHMPARIGDYTDFYASREHATNVGKLFRPGQAPLMPNWLHLPVGYHGRASSVVLSGTDIRRPCGQLAPPPPQEGPPKHGPSNRLDYELEMAFFVGPGNAMGHPMKIETAADHIFGLVVMNDWSSRDIQRWEYVPLGPFGAKNFGTTISPWVVTMDALEPFRCPGPDQSEVELLPYLQEPDPYSFDIQLSVGIQTPTMAAPEVICNTNMRYMYYSIRQQLVHHTVTGCNVQPGDLLGTGTISGPEPGSLGSLLEMSQSGKQDVAIGASGETRKFLQDGDLVVMSGFCQGDGYRIGFGECTGRILPAIV